MSRMWDFLIPTSTWLLVSRSIVLDIVLSLTVMLWHSGWTALPAPEADTDAEARRTPARHNVGGFSLDQTRPARRHAPADTYSCSDARRTPLIMFLRGKMVLCSRLFTPFSFSVTIIFYLIVLYYSNILFDFFFVIQIFYLIFSLLLKYFIWLVWYFFLYFFREQKEI